MKQAYADLKQARFEHDICRIDYKMSRTRDNAKGMCRRLRLLSSSWTLPTTTYLTITKSKMADSRMNWSCNASQFIDAFLPAPACTNCQCVPPSGRIFVKDVGPLSADLPTNLGHLLPKSVDLPLNLCSLVGAPSGAERLKSDVGPMLRDRQSPNVCSGLLESEYIYA